MLSKLKALLKNKLVKNGIGLLVLEAFNCVLPFLTVPHITRILTPDRYGVFSVGLQWVSYLQVLVLFAFDLSATRKITLCKSKEEESFIYSKVYAARALLCIASAVILVGLLLFVQLEESIKISMALLFMMVIGSLTDQNWFFKGKEDIKTIMIVNMACRILTTALIFILIRSTEDVYLYCVLYSVTFVLSGVISSILARTIHKIKFVAVKIKDVFGEIKDSFVLFLSSAMTKIFSGFGIIYLGMVASNAEVGVYSAIMKIVTLVVMLWTPISQVIYPAISKEYAISFGNGLNKLKKMAVPVLGLFVFGLAVLSIWNGVWVELLFGAEYLHGATVLIILCAWTLMGIINNFLGIQTLVASGNENKYAVSFAASMVINIALVVLLGSSMGMYGIAYANLISESVLTVVLAIQIARVRKATKESVL